MMTQLNVDEVQECPLCMEVLDIDDRSFFPCTCGYQICRFCWHRIRLSENGLCPACRKPYPENPANFKPLSVEELQKMKAQKRQKEQMKKQKTVDNRRHLADLRVVQKNLVFVVGIAQRIADPEMLKKPEYFGKFGKIQKVVVNPCLQGTSAGAYITYYKSEDALRAIQSVNNLPFDGRTIKASLGTTKYCSHFMRNQQCPKAECMYLHQYGDAEASFTKEDMQLGKHQEYEKKLIEDFIQAAGAVNIKKQNKQRTISGGSSSAITPSNSYKEEGISNIEPEAPEEEPTDAGDSSSKDEDEDEPEDDEEIEDEEEEEEEHDELNIEESSCTNNIQDDDLGFDPFHETQKAFEELIQEESQRAHHYPTNYTHQLTRHHPIHGHHPQLHTLIQQQQLHHPSISVPLSHPQSLPPQLAQQQQNPGSNIYPTLSNGSDGWFETNRKDRTLQPPPGFNTHTQQQQQQHQILQHHHQQQQQQQQHHHHAHHHILHPQSSQTNHQHHWTSNALNHHNQYKPAPIKTNLDWMLDDPAIIFSSNHLRQQPNNLGQQQQQTPTPTSCPPGFYSPTINGHNNIKTHPHY